MEKFEHPLLIVHWVNALLGRLVQVMHSAVGIRITPDAHGNIIPPFMVMVLVIVVGFALLEPSLGRRRFETSSNPC